ncbi:uncharacterized protein LOC109800796 isoform X2 [Cajanus cajan]|uniref:uncharacterized protein LOC109800796 isoform X2 n=1 Tax=Cajanus cajan TaxID=3821 RepID=UPI0010FBACAA|nr:uncharacterized protein LOC109800796 isoform X2 [Cajanus cajan]
MVCLESWTFEIMVLLSGAFPNAKLETSVLSICLNTSGILWMVPFGVSDAGRYCQRMRLAETWCNCQSRIFLFYRRSFFCCDSFCPPYERTGNITILSFRKHLRVNINETSPIRIRVFHC